MSTGISWTRQREGNLRRIARIQSLDPEEYLRRHREGEKWCGGCRRWRDPEKHFQTDNSRWDGRASRCADCRNAKKRRRHVPKTEPYNPGPDRIPRRSGDKLQARRRINHDVENGLRPDPNLLHCAYCGHKGEDRRHEYHHHMGYDAAHHYDVLPACTRCHKD